MAEQRGRQHAPGVLRHDQAYAEITGAGWWGWEIRLYVPVVPGWGMAADDRRWAATRHGAERKARRIVTRYIRQHAPRQREVITVRAEDERG